MAQWTQLPWAPRTPVSPTALFFNLKHRLCAIASPQDPHLIPHCLQEKATIHSPSGLPTASGVLRVPTQAGLPPIPHSKQPHIYLILVLVVGLGW